MTHTETINDQEVIFETVAVAERFDHSTEYFMDGYTGDKLTHTAIGSFAIGSDDFEEISYIEEVEYVDAHLNEIKQPMGWNHRILAHEDGEEMYFQIHEVYYDKEGNPNGYTTNGVSVGGDTIKSITWTLNKMKECRAKPVLFAGDKFPNEYKIEL